MYYTEFVVLHLYTLEVACRLVGEVCIHPLQEVELMQWCCHGVVTVQDGEAEEDHPFKHNHYEDSKLLQQS